MNIKTSKIILREVRLPRVLTGLCFSLALAACGDSEALVGRASELASDQFSVDGPTHVKAIASPAHDLPDAREQATQGLTITSSQDLRLAATRVEDARPAFYSAVMNMQARRTRNDLLRYTEPEMHDADAAAIFARRLLDEPGAPNLERLAMVDAIARTTGNFGPYLVVLLSSEKDAEVRASLIDKLRRADPEAARKGLELTLEDSDAGVREAALRTFASQSDLRSEALTASMLTALEDGDEKVRVAAAFAARVRQENSALDQLVLLASREHEGARLQALRAIENIDASRLAAFDMSALAADSDDRIARFATRVAASSLQNHTP